MSQQTASRSGSLTIDSPSGFAFGHGTLAVLVLLAMFVAAFAAPARAECTPHWLSGAGLTALDTYPMAMLPWDPDGPGPQQEVIVVGGAFTAPGARPLDRIACWDPATSTWWPLGGGVSGDATPYVSALAALDGKLYAAGRFSTAGGVTAANIACWDPVAQTWSALGSGLNGSASGDFASALVVLNGELYVGGSFTTAGGVSASNVARWDPATQTWSALGHGLGALEAIVRCLAVFDGKLYAGGSHFLLEGDVPSWDIACWDPGSQTWSGLGSGLGLDQSVWDIVALNGKLYVGGWFSSVGGISAENLACWDPATQSWSAFPGVRGDPIGVVKALTVLDGKLYAGGLFAFAGGVSASGIACWDPPTSTWSALDSGLGGGTFPQAYSLTGSNGIIYVGGPFTTAGGQISPYVARWSFCPEPTPIAAVSRKDHGSSGAFDINVCASSAIESRKDGPTNVLVSFDKLIERYLWTLGDVQVSQGSVTSLEVINDSTLDIGLTGVAGPQPLTISFPGIVARDTSELVSQSLCFRVLPGDASGDGIVNTSDYIAVRGRIGLPLNSYNCRFDVSADGAINTSDYVFIRGRIGGIAVSCP